MNKSIALLITKAGVPKTMKVREREVTGAEIHTVHRYQFDATHSS